MHIALMVVVPAIATMVGFVAGVKAAYWAASRQQQQLISAARMLELRGQAAGRSSEGRRPGLGTYSRAAAGRGDT